MGAIKKFAIVVGLTSVFLGYIIHRPIPAKVPDEWHFQLLVDFLSACEVAAGVSEWFGINRWWSYPGNINIAIPRVYPPGMDITKVTLAGVDSVVITPQDFKTRTKPGPALIFYHGGGWVFGSLHTYMDLLVMAAEETGFVVISPEYRKSPEHTFPIPYEDCLNSTIEFIQISKQFNVDKDKIILAGDSAGGNLAMAVTLQLIEMKRKDETSTVPAMTTLIYPILQMMNFRLPSYQQNEPFMFRRDLVSKLWLSYIGLNNQLDLSRAVTDNGHVDRSKKSLEKYLDIVDADLIPEKYKTRGYNSTVVEMTENLKLMLTDEVMSHMEQYFLDIRVAPLMADDELLSQMPPTHILVCEYDQLRDDGILLHNRLKRLGLPVSLQYLPNSLHATASLGAIFKDTYYGKQNSIFFKIIKDHF